MIHRIFLLLLIMTCAATAEAGQDPDELRRALALDLPPSWSYLAQHEESGTVSVFELESDSVHALAEWLGLGRAQAEQTRALLERYREIRRRELDGIEKDLRHLQAAAPGQPGDEHLDLYLEQVEARVVRILDRRKALEEEFEALLTPSQVDASRSLVQSDFSSELSDLEFPVAPDFIAEDIEESACPPNVCTDSVMIIGCDDRRKRYSCTRGVRPWASVGRFSTGCTGTLIGPRHVLTAAHCLRATGTVIGFSLGQYSGTWKPYGTQYVRRTIRPGEYGGGASIAVKVFDYALVELWHSPPGGLTMPYGYESWGALRNASAYSIGYPGTTGTFAPGSVVESGRQRFLDTPPSVRWRNGGDSGLLYTSIDGEGGQSGSPVYRFNNSGRKMVGVLIGSPQDHCRLGRVWAARLTPGAVHRINTWRSNFSSSAFPAVRSYHPYQLPDAAYAPRCPSIWW